MTDDTNRCVPIYWCSKKANRVVRSTLTAETLAAIEAAEMAFVVKTNLQEILEISLPSILLYVDNKSLAETAVTTNVLADKRLMIDMSSLRQMVERREICIQWISTKAQIADIFTKAGVNPLKLTQVLSSGRLDRS